MTALSGSYARLLPGSRLKVGHFVPGQAWVDAGPEEDLLSAGRMAARIGEIDVLVVRNRHGLFAFENRCSHAGRSLDDACVSRSTLTCAGHGVRYDLNTGTPLTRVPHVHGRLRTFEAITEGGRVWISPKPK